MNDIAELTIKINSMEAELAKRRLNDLEKQGKETAGSAAILEAAYAKLMRVLGPAALAGAFALAVRSAINLQDQYVRLSEIAGTTAVRMAAFDLASRKSGTSMEAVAQSIARLGKAIGDARLGDEQQGGLLRALGINPNDGRDAAEVFIDVSRAIIGMKDQNIAAVASQQLLSRGFAEMRPIMKEVVEMGTLQARQTEEQIQAAKELADELEALNFEWDQAKIQMVEQLGPAFRAIIELTKDMVREGTALEFFLNSVVVVFQTVAVLGSDVAFVFRMIYGEIKVLMEQVGILVAANPLNLGKLLLEDFINGTDNAKKALQNLSRIPLISEDWTKQAAKARAELDAFQQKVMAIGKSKPVAPGGAMDMEGSGGVFKQQPRQAGNSEAERRVRELMEFEKNYPKLVQAEKDFAQQYADAIRTGNELAREAHKQGLLSDESLIQQLAANEDARLQVLAQSLEKQAELHGRKGDVGKQQEALGQVQQINAQRVANEAITQAQITSLRTVEDERYVQELAQRTAALQESYLHEYQIVEQAHTERLNLAEIAYNRGLITQQEFENLSVQSHALYNEEMVRISDEATQREFGIREVHRKLDLNSAKTFLGNMSLLMNTKSKELFEIGKIAAISETVINTYSAAMGAYKALASIPYVGPALGAAAAAAAIAYGMSQVQAINAQQFGSKSAGGGGAPVGTFAASPTTGLPAGAPSEQVIHMKGVSPTDVFTGQQLRDLFERLNDEETDGMRRKVVFTS